MRTEPNPTRILPNPAWIALKKLCLAQLRLVSLYASLGVCNQSRVEPYMLDYFHLSTFPVPPGRRWNKKSQSYPQLKVTRGHFTYKKFALLTFKSAQDLNALQTEQSMVRCCRPRQISHEHLKKKMYAHIAYILFKTLLFHL